MRKSPTIFIIPTGIGCDIGGFAGDALPSAKLLAAASGCLITHPNVMNGGALSELDERIFYVEGYSLDRFARGEIGLTKVNYQKLGIIFDSNIDHHSLVRHLQVVDACIATLGLNIISYALTNEPIGVVTKKEAGGISGGYIENPESLIKTGKKLIDNGATAIAVVAKFPDEINFTETNSYRKGEGIDPIAGVEAIISHLISKFLKVPCAHSPALSEIKLDEDLDPRAAAEEIGYTFLPSVLIGLSRSPNLVELSNTQQNIDLYPSQIESIVVPQGALGGEAVLSLMEMDKTIIAVKNSNIMRCNNEQLNYKNLINVDNYYEAAGVLTALREGINLKSIERPLSQFKNTYFLN